MGLVLYLPWLGQATEATISKLFRGGKLCIDPEAALKIEKTG